MVSVGGTKILESVSVGRIQIFNTSPSEARKSSCRQVDGSMGRWVGGAFWSLGALLGEVRHENLQNVSVGGMKVLESVTVGSI